MGPQVSRGNGTQNRVDRSREFTPIDGDRVEVTDFDFAAFLLMEGARFVDARRISDREHIFIFQDQVNLEEVPSQIRALSIKYVNSESARFADALRRIKKTTYSIRTSSDPRR
jgi:hypothetical protein